MSDELQSAQVLREIAAERQRQVHVEGYTREADDRYPPGELARAGAAYAMFAGLDDALRAALADGSGGIWRTFLRLLWPWRRDVFKPKADRRRELVIAASLMVAAIEYEDRARRRARTKGGAP